MATARVGSVTTYDSASSYSATVNKPTGATIDDLLLAIIGRNANVDPTTVPSGWTLLAKTTSEHRRELYYKVISSESEPSSYTWEWPVKSVKTRVNIIAYRGNFNTTTPIQTISSTLYDANDTVMRGESIYSHYANQTLIAIGSIYRISSTSSTVPTSQDNNWSEDFDGGNTNSDYYHSVYRAEWSGSGLTGDVDITASTAIIDKHVFLLALNLTDVYSNRPGVNSGSNMIFEYAPNTNYNTLEYYQIGEVPDLGGYATRGLYTFDLSFLSGKTIVSAFLDLHSDPGGSGTAVISAFRMLSGNSDWNFEQSTWNVRKTGTAWAGSVGCSTPDTDYDADALGTITVSAPSTKYSMNIDPDLLSLLVANNYGLMLRTPYHEGSNRNISSCNNVEIPFRPNLIVKYSEGEEEIAFVPRVIIF